MRFVVVQEPADTWAVFDSTVDVPADFAGQCLVGLTRVGAEWLAARCNQEALRRNGRLDQNTREDATPRFEDPTNVSAYSC
jgi:hypothetical protein